MILAMFRAARAGQARCREQGITYASLATFR